ncbi:hypothetical protein LP316_03795 [Thalassotalea sp. LPB0316]|uniref:hypothetical protein n=1 Tax=Thalassotalea sp. LPB0316 TaxID=2769490 RepID=UPI0018660894|nr:hypothetical protein [Thalassotalea sp. LPB0316]QOL26435.1 hypothetical protein LP316_03795 [Thalassotalea sp. LPB0316]
MSNDKFDQELTTLFQQRKNSLNVPEFNVEQALQSQSADKASDTRRWFKPFGLILGGLTVSAATFAVMVSMLKQPKIDHVPNQTTDVSVVELEVPTNTSVPDTLPIPELPVQPEVPDRPTSAHSLPEQQALTVPSDIHLITPADFRLGELQIAQPNTQLKPLVQKLPVIDQQAFEVGMIKLGFDIDRQGQVRNVITMENSTNLLMLKATKRALSQWRYAKPETEIKGMEIIFEFTDK